MITKLTPEQEAQIPEFREKWRAIGLLTEPIDRTKAVEAVSRLYTTTSLNAPQLTLVLKSPMSCLLARALLEQLLNNNFFDRLKEPHPHDHFNWQGQPNTRSELYGINIRDLYTNLARQLAETRGWPWSVPEGQAIVAQCLTLMSELGPIQDLLKDKPIYQTTWFWGSQDVYWIALFDFAEHIGVVYEPKVKEHFEAYKNYTLTCGWLYPYEHVAFVSDRPELIRFDEQRRLHRPDGPAIRFRDGYSIYAWHGVRVPAWVIDTPEKITVKAIQEQSNQEIARCMREIMGHERFLKELRPKILHKDECGVLMESECNGETWLIVEVEDGTVKPDGTRRKYYLDVTCAEEHVGYPIKTARAAVAATYGFSDPKDYKPTLRT